MTLSLAQRHLLAALGWLATVATSLSLFPALAEKRYFLIGAALSALVALLGMAGRQLHVPTLVVLSVQVLVVGDILLTTYGGHTWRGLVPTSATFSSVRDVLSAGMDVANRYAAPVPHSPGLMLMTVGFIAFVAIAVDQLIAGLGRPPLAGLALLALYAVPVAALPDGVPAWCFVPGAAAYLALLMVAEHERLAHWGRHVATSSVRNHVDTIDTSALSSTGRRISALAITTAVIAPLLVPGFSRTLFHGESGIGNGTGTLSFNDPMVSLAESLHRKEALDLIHVSSEREPTYLRLAVLDQPGANAWRSSGIDIDSTLPTNVLLPPPTGLSSDVDTTPASLSLSLSPDFPGNSPWLPVPFDLTSINVTMRDGGFPEDFAYVPRDQTVTGRTTGAVSRLAGYTAAYKVVSPTQLQLEGAPAPPANMVQAYARVPVGVPDVVARVARDVTLGAADDYQRALDLQSFFRDSSSFSYDLDAAYGYGYRAMARFLTARRGYCQHFAATMAMMARELGIPSRVVVGFLDPSAHDSKGDFVFTSHDAHAWPELFFSGVGWVRFEPTPGNGAQIPGYTRIVPVRRINPTPTTPTTTDAGGGPGKLPDEQPTSTKPTAAGANAGGGGGSGGVPPLGWLVVVVLGAAALAPAAVRVALRRSRLARAIDGGASCEYAWLELRDRVVDLRLPWSGALTPRARQRFVEPLLGGDPDGVAALDRLSMTVERARYAGSPVPDADPRGDAREVMAAITRQLDRGQRLKAFLWPASLLPSLRTSWGQLVQRRFSSRADAASGLPSGS